MCLLTRHDTIRQDATWHGRPFHDQVITLTLHTTLLETIRTACQRETSISRGAQQPKSARLEVDGLVGADRRCSPPPTRQKVLREPSSKTPETTMLLTTAQCVLSRPTAAAVPASPSHPCRVWPRTPPRGPLRILSTTWRGRSVVNRYRTSDES